MCADNVTPSASGNAVVLKTDDDTVAHWPYTKVAFGADGTRTRVQTSAPFPVMVTHVSDNAAINISTMPNVTLANPTAIDITGTAKVSIVDVSAGVAINISTMPSVTIANATAIDITGSHSVVITSMPVVDINSATAKVKFIDGSAKVDSISASVNVVFASAQTIGVTSLGSSTVFARFVDGSATIDAISATVTVHVANELSVLRDGIIASAGQSSVPKYITLDRTASGSITIIAAVASKKIRVIATNFITKPTNAVTFYAGSSGAQLTGHYKLLANSGMVWPLNEHGWLETSAGEGLVISLSATGTFGGVMTYIEI